ncbi:MAG: hypothetical protein AAF250_10655 [Pseudomonadota bacterium]
MIFSLSPLAAILMAATATETAPASLCKADEETIISGAVEDDFGLDVAVCVSRESTQVDPGETTRPFITIRWSGEGGGDAISCIPSQCDGTVEYSRYTSPHLTILQLAWTNGEYEQRLYQELNRSYLDSPVRSVTTHTWTHKDASTNTVYVDSYPVRTDASSLALMNLEQWLTPKSWTESLLVSSD